MLKTLLILTFFFLLFAQNGLNIKKETCGVLKAHFNNPTPAEWTAGNTNAFTQIVITTDVAETAKVECVVSYFGYTSTMPVRLDLKDSSLTTLATTGDFIPIAGWNTIDFTSFTAKGTGKTFTVWITTGSGTGKIILYSGYLKYLPH
jgi:hypothetical protein